MQVKVHLKKNNNYKLMKKCLVNSFLWKKKTQVVVVKHKKV